MKKRLPLILATAWFIISVILLTIPGSDLPKEDWLSKIWIDKWIHIGMFALLVFLWCNAFVKKYPFSKRLKIIWGMAVLWLAYGVVMEFVQKYFIPLRTFDIGDIIADGTGSVVGALYSIKRYVKK